MSSKSRNLAEVQALTNDIELTQYGEIGTEFNNRLRTHIGETEMSLALGRQTPMAVALLVTKTVHPAVTARYTTVGRLREQGFTVSHVPTRGNPLHVSVAPPAGPSGPMDWDDEMAKIFDECFTDDGGGGCDE